MTSPRAYLSLPADWALRPMTDEDLFEGVVDLVIRDDDRRRGCLVVLACQTNGRLMEALPLEGLHPFVDAAGSGSVVTKRVGAILEALRAIAVAGVVLVLARPGRPVATAGDRQVLAQLEALCAPPRPALLGVALATPEGVATLPRSPGTQPAAAGGRDGDNRDEPGTPPATRRAS